MKDKDQIGWYYRSIAEALMWVLGKTLAWQEYRGLVEETWGIGEDNEIVRCTVIRTDVKVAKE